MCKKWCYIAGAGDFSGRILPGNETLIIAADGGYESLAAVGITPDLIVGDFDSLVSTPNHPGILRHPAEKNDTDLMLAVREGLLRGCDAFVIDGALGGRLDHTIANIQILTFLTQNRASGVLVGQNECVTAVKDGTILFKPGASGYISVFCAGDSAEGVFLEGLKYPLTDAVLTCGFPLGVSNEFTEKAASVTVQSGTLIVTWACGPEFLLGVEKCL